MFSFSVHFFVVVVENLIGEIEPKETTKLFSLGAKVTKLLGLLLQIFPNLITALRLPSKVLLSYQFVCFLLHYR